MDGGHLASAIVALGGLLVGVLSYFKYKPGQKETTDMTVAQSTLNIAQGTIDLVTSELEQQFKRMSTEQTEQREIHRKEQAELRQMHVEQVESERKSAAALKKQIAEANEEVRVLRAALREAQVECDNWRKKYEALKSKVNGAT